MNAHCVMAQSAEMQIRLNRTTSNGAIARHDADGIFRDMLKEYSIVTGPGQHVEGRDSVLAFWRKTFIAMSRVVYLRTPVSIVVSKNDSFAWETGQWVAQHSYSGGGNYSAMWRKTDSAWRLAADLFVSPEK